MNPNTITIDSGVAALLGTLLGAIGGFIASTIQFEREKGERRKDELKTNYKELWMLLHELTDAFYDGTNRLAKSKMQSAPSKTTRPVLSRTTPLAKIQFLLLYVAPQLKPKLDKLMKLREEWNDAWNKASDATPQDENVMVLALIHKAEEIKAHCKEMQEDIMKLVSGLNNPPRGWLRR